VKPEIGENRKCLDFAEQKNLTDRSRNRQQRSDGVAGDAVVAVLQREALNVGAKLGNEVDGRFDRWSVVVPVEVGELRLI
jgi:hypothetical protein